MHTEGLLGSEEDPFGPGSDLVMSLMVALLLLVALGAGFYQISSNSKLVAESRDNSTLKFRATDSFRDEAFSGSGLWKLNSKKEAELRSKVVELRDGLGKNKFQLLEVTGHASPEGGQEYNMALAELRAAEVATQLARAGIPWECIRISAVGRGESEKLTNYWRTNGPQQVSAAFKPRSNQNDELRDKYGDELKAERRVEIEKLVIRRGGVLCRIALEARTKANTESSEVLDLNRIMQKKLNRAKDQRPLPDSDTREDPKEEQQP